MVDFTSGYVTAGVGCFHVVVNQLVPEITDVGIIGACYLPGRYYLIIETYLIILPSHAIHVRGQIPHLGVIDFPFTYGITADSQGLWIIYARSDVGRTHALVLVGTDVNLDILYAAYVIGIGINGKGIVGIHRSPAFSLAAVCGTWICRIALNPPH